MDISYATPTTLESPEHVVIAEELGYKRAWFYDTPQQSPDVWMMLALAAERTERIGLGPGVLVPSLRHPMVNAAATAALRSARAPPGGRGVRDGVHRSPGDGRPQADQVVVHGGLHPRVPRAPARRDRRVGRSADADAPPGRTRRAPPRRGPGDHRRAGPEGRCGRAGPGRRRVRDGLCARLCARVRLGRLPLPWHRARRRRGAELGSGARAAGPGTVLALHGVWEYNGPVAEMPGGAAWLAQIERVPEAERHLTVHEQHCVGLNAADAAAWVGGAHALLKDVTVSGTGGEVRQRLATLAEQGVTEVVYQPAGPDIRRELERFMETASTSHT